VLRLNILLKIPTAYNSGFASGGRQSAQTWNILQAARTQSRKTLYVIFSHATLHIIGRL